MYKHTAAAKTRTFKTSKIFNSAENMDKPNVYRQLNHKLCVEDFLLLFALTDGKARSSIDGFEFFPKA